MLKSKWKGLPGMALFLLMIAQTALSFGAYYKFYPGEPLPREKTAFIVVDYGVIFVKFTPDLVKKWPNWPEGVELLPGSYYFFIGYDSLHDFSGVPKHWGKDFRFSTRNALDELVPISFKVNLIAEHTYYLIPDWEAMKNNRAGDAIFVPALYDITDCETRQALCRQFKWQANSLEKTINSVKLFFMKKVRKEPTWDPEKIATQSRVDVFNKILARIRVGDILELKFPDQKKTVKVVSLIYDGFEYSVIGEEGKYFLNPEVPVEITIQGDAS